GEAGDRVDEAGVGVGDAEGAGEDASSGIARDDRRASTGYLPATLGGEAGEAGVVRAAELRDAALGVYAAALGVVADAGRAGAARVAGAGPAVVILGLRTGGVPAGHRSGQHLGGAGGEGQLDVERGRGCVAQRHARARQQVEPLACDHHLAVHTAVGARSLGRGRALADAADVAAAARDLTARADLGERRAQVDVGEQRHQVAVREANAGIAGLEVEVAAQGLTGHEAGHDADRRAHGQRGKRRGEGRTVDRAGARGARAGALEAGRAVASVEAVA